jgi:acetyl esterase
MALHPQAQAVLEAMVALGDPAVHEDTPTEARARREARIRPPTEDVHERREVDAGGVPARLYRPSDEPGLGLLVYFHGGGWVLGSLDGHDNVCRALANRSGAAVLSVGYRLAPEHPFPAGLEDAVTATRWAHAHAEELGGDPHRLAIGGDSAGANLAAVVAQGAVAPLRFQLLVYPVTDARCAAPSYDEHAEGYLLTTKVMAWFVDHYLSGGQGAPDHPRVSPLLADPAVVAATPPAWVATAEYDPLRDDGVLYADRLREAGVDVTRVHYDGMMHGFVSLADLIDDGQAALTAAGEALAAALA